MTKKKETKSRNEYWREYKKKVFKRFNIYIRKDEKEVLKKLENVDSKSQYIINLIKEDIKNKEVEL